MNNSIHTSGTLPEDTLAGRTLVSFHTPPA
jgi:hypothetical protein